MKRTFFAKLVFALMLLCCMSWGYTLTITLTPEGSGMVSPTSKTVSGKTSVDISASTTVEGRAFYYWSYVSGSKSYCQVDDIYAASTRVYIDNGDCILKATFIYVNTMSVVAGEGGLIKARNMEEVPWTESATRTIRRSSVGEALAQANPGYVFDKWESSDPLCTIDDDKDPQTQVKVRTDCTIKANFLPAHTVTVKHVNWDGAGTTTVTMVSVGEGKSKKLDGMVGKPYKPNSWKVTSGTCVVSDAPWLTTFLTMKTDDCTVEVQYEHTTPVKIDVGINNFTLEDFYQIRPDLTAYVLETSNNVWYFIELSTSYGCHYYGTDSTFSHLVLSASYPAFYVGGDGNKHYFTCGVADYHSVKVSEIFTLKNAEIGASKGGSVNYQGVTNLPSGINLPLVATAEPYYRFVRWNVLGGTCKFADPLKFETELYTETSNCYVRAEFEVDSTIVPKVELVGVDRSEYPKKICADYGMTLNGVDYKPDASFFSLKENDSEIAYDLSSSIKRAETQLDVALVLDGSSSMSDLNSQVKETVKQFIDSLGSNVSLSIIEYGPYGGDTYAKVLHGLSKDKISLKKSMNSYISHGNTTTMAGVKKALDELDNATGKKLMLLVTEGATNVRTFWFHDLLVRAQSMDVKIQSFYLNAGESWSISSLMDVDSLTKYTGGSILGVSSVDKLLEPLLSAVNEYANISVSTVCYAPKDTIQNGEINKVELYYEDFTREPLNTIIWEKPKCVESDVEDLLYMNNVDVLGDDSARELITRSTTALNLRVSTQNFVGDCRPWLSVPVNVSCKKSGDVETFWLGHVSGGEYGMDDVLRKREGIAIKDNGVLECSAGDEIVAVYQDPVYGTIVKKSATIHDDVYGGNSVVTEHGFVDVDGVSSLDSVEAAREIPFTIDISAHSESIYDVDSIKVLLFTSQGDTLEVYVKETDVYSSIFRLEDQVSIVFDSLEMRDDRLEILMNGDDGFNSAFVYAEVESNDAENFLLDSFVVYYDFPKNEIAVYDGEDAEAVIDRSTEYLLVYVNTWSSFDEIDEIGASLRCRNSGDSEVVTLVEMGGTTDRQKMFGMEFSIPKNELETVRNDGSLSCAAVDTIVAEYISPYYKAPIVAEYAFADSAVIVPLDSAEIYDRNGDGRADFVRMHFADVVDVGLLRVDTVFWNAEGRKGRGVSNGRIQVSKEKNWYEAELDEAFDYGVTSLESVEKNYLAVSKKAFNYSKKVKLADKMGAVPVFAEKRPGRINEGNLLGDGMELPPDSLVVTLSEPLEIVEGASGKDNETWKKLFQFAGDCNGKMHAVALTQEPKVDESGKVWTLVLPRKIDVRVGHCLMTNPAASYQDAAGNAPAVGGVTVEGDDGDAYIYSIYPSPAISYDTLSAVKTHTRLGYRASILIFDNLGHYISQFRYNLKVDNDKEAQVGTISWDQHTEDGRQVGTGIYIWKILFVFEDGHKELHYVRTGIKQ